MQQESNLPKTTPKDTSESSLPLGIMILLLGTSAGFTLYTKKTGSMLSAMKQIEKNQLRNRPPKFGPETKEMHEKMKPRIDKDEFF